jgi:hypothetical protein
VRAGEKKRQNSCNLFVCFVWSTHISFAQKSNFELSVGSSQAGENRASPNHTTLLARSQRPATTVMASAMAIDGGVPMAEPAAGAPATRLIIERIEMVNFKSYFGEQVIGPFHKVVAHANPSPPAPSPLNGTSS